MTYRGSSNRSKDGHGTTFFSNSRETVERWAKAEAKDGFRSEVWAVLETFLGGFEPKVSGVEAVTQPPVAPKVPPVPVGSGKCTRGHTMRGKPECPVCGAEERI